VIRGYDVGAPWWGVSAICAHCQLTRELLAFTVSSAVFLCLGLHYTENSKSAFSKVANLGVLMGFSGKTRKVNDYFCKARCSMD